jgi:hypothetical protein
MPFFILLYSFLLKSCLDILPDCFSNSYVYIIIPVYNLVNGMQVYFKGEI